MEMRRWGLREGSRGFKGAEDVPRTQWTRTRVGEGGVATWPNRMCEYESCGIGFETYFETSEDADMMIRSRFSPCM